MPMLLARTPMKPAGDVCEDVPKPVKWLRCLQCNQKFPEDRFREHQRESKSPCELVRKHDGIVTRPDGATPLPNELHVMSRLRHASHTLGHGNRVCVSPTRAFSRRRPSVRSSETSQLRGSGDRSDTWRDRDRTRVVRTRRTKPRAEPSNPC